MAKKVKKKTTKKAVKKRIKKVSAPKGPRYVCSVCGTEMVVTKEGTSPSCSFICCGQPMTKKE